MKIVLSDFLKAETCQGGEVIQIMDEGEESEITSPEGKVKMVRNFGVKVIKGSKNLKEGQETTYTPNRSALEVFIEAWGDESTEWINKQFEITLVKVNVFGKMKDSIYPKVLNGDDSNEKPETPTVKM